MCCLQSTQDRISTENFVYFALALWNREANKKQYRILCFIAAKECYTRRDSFFGKNNPCHLASKLHNKLNQLRRSETHWTKILKRRPKTKSCILKRRSETHWTWSLKRKSETQWTWISTEDLKNTTCIKNSLQLLWWCAKRHHTNCIKKWCMFKSTPLD